MKFSQLLLLSALLSFVSILTPHYSSAQNGPGGVGSSADNIFWLDVYQEAYNNGDFVNTLVDQSGNGNDFSIGNIVRNPIYTDNSVNNVPGLTFDGANDFLQSGAIPALETNTFTWFVVSSKVGSKAQSVISAKYSGTSFFHWASYVNAGDDRMVNYFKNIAKFNRVTTGNTFSISGNTVSPTQLNSYLNGSLAGTKTSTFSATANHVRCRIGGGLTSNNSYPLEGDICEAFHYNKVLNNIEMEIVHNYLSSKYAIAMPAADDHYAFESTGHYYELAGIGQESGLSVTDAKGSGAVRMNNASTLGNDDFVLWAHDNGSTNADASDVPPSFPAAGTRMERMWRVDLTNSPGTVDVSFNLNGILFGGLNTEYYLIIDNDDDFSNGTLQEIQVSSFAGNIATFTGVNFGDGNFFSIGNTTGIESITDGNWADVNTWNCACIPVAAQNPTIKATHEVIVNTNSSEVNDLDIEPTGSLVFDPGMDLFVAGDITNAGTIDGTTGTLHFFGTQSQTLTSTTDISLGSLSIENSIGGVDFTGGNDVFIVDSLSLTNGNLDVTGLSSLRIISNASGTGRVGIITGGTLTGNISMQRFFSGSDGAGFRDICSPVIGTTFSDWDDDIYVSGDNFADGCAFGNNGCFHSIYSWDETLQDYAAVTNPSATINNGEGYEVFIGSSLTTLGDTSFIVSGELNPVGTISLTVHDGNGTSGFTIVGNPYCSQINFDNMTPTNSFIGDFYYVFDPVLGIYDYYSQSIGGGGLSNIIAASQGFYVNNSNNATHNSGFFELDQTAKTSAAADFKSSFIENNLLSLHVVNNASGYTGKFSLYQNVKTRSSYNRYEDNLHIPHLNNNRVLAPVVYGVEQDTLQLRTLGLDNLVEQRIPLKVAPKTIGTHTFSLDNLDNFYAYDYIYLKDLSTGTIYDLSNGSSIELELLSEVSSFELILKNEAFVVEEEMNESIVDIYAFNNTIMLSSTELTEGNVQVLDATGKIIFSNQLSLSQTPNEIRFDDISSGVYIVRFVSAFSETSKKLFLKQ